MELLERIIITAIGIALATGLVKLVLWLWRKWKAPIDYLDEQDVNWTAEEKQMIRDAGYDLTKLKWVIVREIPQHKAQGWKPVLIPRWCAKVEVHLPRKGQGEYAQLFERP